jgi:hypothetical protein
LRKGQDNIRQNCHGDHTGQMLIFAAGRRVRVRSGAAG